MTMQPFTPPEHMKEGFNCPFCNAYAKQVWGQVSFYNFGEKSYSLIDEHTLSHCTYCTKLSIWKGKEMIYPDASVAPLPNPGLPDDIRGDYEEARRIVNRSPRGAAALFRLCIQKLLAHLGESGNNLNTDIASLVKKGLNPRIQKSLDIVRVIGNEAVHPGTIDLRDDVNIAVQLSKLINFITDAMITQPNQIDSLYDALPNEKKEQIKTRDTK